MTNKGLHISLNLFPYGLKDGMFIVPLECSSLGKDGKERDVCPAILLQKKVVHSVERYGRAFVRNEKKLLTLTHDEIRSRMLETKGNINRYIYIKDRPEYERPKGLYYGNWVVTFNTCPLQEYGFVVSGHESDVDERRVHNWDKSKPDEIVLKLRSYNGMVARVPFVNNQARESIVLAIVVRSDADPCVLVLTTANGPPLRGRNAALSQPLFVATSHTVSETSDIPAPRAKPLEEEDPVASPASEKIGRDVIQAYYRSKTPT